MYTPSLHLFFKSTSARSIFFQIYRRSLNFFSKIRALAQLFFKYTGGRSTFFLQMRFWAVAVHKIGKCIFWKIDGIKNYDGLIYFRSRNLARNTRTRSISQENLDQCPKKNLIRVRNKNWPRAEIMAYRMPKNESEGPQIVDMPKIDL